MIKLGKDLYFKNLLSFRKTLTQNEIQKEMNDIDNFIKENGLKLLLQSFQQPFQLHKLWYHLWI